MSVSNTKTRRGTVEDLYTQEPVMVVRKVSKDSVHYWKGKLRRQRYGSKSDGSFQELPALYVRIHHRGREHAFTFQTLDQNFAATQARDIYRDVLARGWEAILADKRPEPAPETGKVTIGRWLSAVAEKRLLDPITLRNYANCLRTVVSEIEGIKGGRARFDYRSGGCKRWREQIDALELSTLTPDRIQTWKAARMTAAGMNVLKLQSARRTINSYIRCSRSLFAPRLRKQMSLVLPEPSPFAGVDLEPSGSMEYRSNLNPKVLFARARTELRDAHPELFKIFLLGFAAGLRKGEVDRLEWTAFQWKHGLLRIEPTETMRLKSVSSQGEIPLDEEVMAEFKRFHKQRKSAYVLHHDRPLSIRADRRVYRCETLFREMNEWLRRHGVISNKPLHTLRKELGALVTSEHGIYAAKEILRHSDISTTARHYADQKRRVSVGLGRLLRESPATR